MPFYLATFLLNGLMYIFPAASLSTEGGVTEVSVVLTLIQLMSLEEIALVWISQTRPAFCNSRSSDSLPFVATAVGVMGMRRDPGLAAVPKDRVAASAA